MDCEKYLELMSAALDGECTEEERRDLDSHLAVCPECAELFRILSANAKAARELDCEMPVGLKERILNNLPEQEKPAKTGKVIRWKRWAPVAAAACVVLVAAATLAPWGVRSNDNASAAPDAANRSGSEPMESSTTDAAEYIWDGDTLVAETEDARDSAVEEPSYSMSSGSEPAEPALYGLGSQQAIRVSYGATPAPGAQIIGSVESLQDYLSGFDSLMWDGEGNTIPIAELEALKETYTEEFFQTRRLLCVVVESGSGSNRYELSSLTYDAVTVSEYTPEAGTCDMAAWLLVAEVDSMFDDGSTLDVVIIN